MSSTTEKITPRVQIRAFVWATLAAPAIIAACFFWVFLIPVYAVYLGGAFYLIFGAPLAFLALRAGQRRAIVFAVIGFIAVLMIVPAWPVIVWITPYRPRDLGVLLGFGLFFGPLWMAVLARIYGRLERAPSPQTQQKG